MISTGCVVSLVLLLTADSCCPAELLSTLTAGAELLVQRTEIIDGTIGVFWSWGDHGLSYTKSAWVTSLIRSEQLKYLCLIPPIVFGWSSQYNISTTTTIQFRERPALLLVVRRGWSGAVCFESPPADYCAEPGVKYFSIIAALQTQHERRRRSVFSSWAWVSLMM